jgi:hypothetical protein
MEGDNTSISLAKEYLKQHPNAVIPERVRSHNNCAVYENNPFYTREPASDEEKNFPIAYAITVHESPEQLERLLRAIYWPHNAYCFHVDQKSNSNLTEYVKHLTKCFPNIVMTKQEDVTYKGFSRLKADLNCMYDLLKQPKWRYVFNLCGRDYPLKTNKQIIEILKKYNGSNVISSFHTSKKFQQRYLNKWAESANHKIVMLNERYSPPPGNITLLQGSGYGVFTRQLIEFIFQDRKVKQFLDWLKNVFSPDEFFWPTLNIRKYNPQLNTPGWYGSFEEKMKFLAKYIVWRTNSNCSAGKFVHGICILSVGDLPVLVKRKEMFANKFFMERDYLVLHCLEEWIHNNTPHYQPPHYRFHCETNCSNVARNHHVPMGTVSYIVLYACITIILQRQLVQF